MNTRRITTSDFGPFLEELNRRTVGYHDLIHRLLADQQAAVSNYPPFNIINTGETTTRIEVAVAGFDEGELEVELKEGLLTISGKHEGREEAEGVSYLHQGISARPFTRTFNLAEHVIVTGASVRNGLLAVNLERIIPEEKKPKKIAIAFQK